MGSPPASPVVSCDCREHRKQASKMSIAYEINLSKYNIGSFSELIPAVMEQAMKIGLEILKRILQERDAEILARRDKARFRCKGLQKTSVKTSMGILDLTRRVYVDTSVTEGVHCVCLLDKEMKIEKIGLTEKALCERAAALACVTSYRNAAEILTAHFAVSMSAMGVWNIVQALGNKEAERVERYAEQSAGTGTVAAPILYEENDGVWLKLQGKDRREYGADKEMKVGIAYDGVTWDAAKTRKELHNKVAYASFEDAKAFKNHKEGVVSHCFDVETVQLRVINGDGAQWIQKNNPKNCLSVLDEQGARTLREKRGACRTTAPTFICRRNFRFAGTSGNSAQRNDGRTGKRKPCGTARLLSGKQRRADGILRKRRRNSSDQSAGRRSSRPPRKYGKQYFYARRQSHERPPRLLECSGRQSSRASPLSPQQRMRGGFFRGIADASRTGTAGAGECGNSSERRANPGNGREKRSMLLPRHASQ